MADTLHRHSELVASDGSPDPALSVNALGNIGIGTTAPLFQLHVAGTTGIGVKAAGVDGTFTDILSSVYSGNSNEQNAIQASVSSGADSSGFNFLVSDGGGAATQKQAYRMSRATHRFYIGGTEKVRIDSNGNVGIGTTAPGAKLDVAGNIAVTGTVDGIDIATDVAANSNKISYNSTASTKLGTIEESADVTDATNVVSSLSAATLTGALTAADHGTAATDQVVNVCYGTGAAPTANTTTIGSLFVKYTA